MRRSVLALMFGLAAGPALGQAPAAPGLDPVTTMVRMDADHDGSASRAEWTAYGLPAAEFDAVDADKDGRVTVAELRAYRRAHTASAAELAALSAETPKFDPALTIRMADANRDGGVSEEEWVAYGNHGGGGFTAIDANHDGRITVEELTAFREAHRPREAQGPSGAREPK
jgi:hypothetical protein